MKMDFMLAAAGAAITNLGLLSVIIETIVTFSLRK
jgi:hypothetical protein